MVWLYGLLQSVSALSLSPGAPALKISAVDVESHLPNVTAGERDRDFRSPEHNVGKFSTRAVGSRERPRGFPSEGRRDACRGRACPIRGRYGGARPSAGDEGAACRPGASRAPAQRSRGTASILDARALDERFRQLDELKSDRFRNAAQEFLLRPRPSIRPRWSASPGSRQSRRRPSSSQPLSTTPSGRPCWWPDTLNGRPYGTRSPGHGRSLSLALHRTHRIRADRRVGRLRGPSAGRRHEGPHHRPGRPQLRAFESVTGVNVMIDDIPERCCCPPLTRSDARRRG